MFLIVPFGESHTRQRQTRSTIPRMRSVLTLLQLEFLNTGLIGRDGGALDSNAILLGSLGGVNGDLVVGLVTVFQAQVVVLQVDVEVSTSLKSQHPGSTEARKRI